MVTSAIRLMAEAESEGESMAGLLRAAFPESQGTPAGLAERIEEWLAEEGWVCLPAFL